MFPKPGPIFPGRKIIDGLPRGPRLGTVDGVRGSVAAAVAAAALLACCTDIEPEPVHPVAPTSTSPPASPAPSASAPTDSPSVTPSPAPAPRVDPDDIRVATVMAAVRHLAGRVGPRPGTSPAYYRAVRWVESELTGLGWSVTRQRFPTPAGVSWGVPVHAGPSVNLVATRGDVVAGEPWLLVGAHLDTVPQAPGAEDNASGIGVLLATAEALAAHRTRLPVVLVAFGSEEPRGPTDADHHYGSTAYVESLSAAERRMLRGMVALDRVGVGAVVPVGSVEDGDPLRDELERAARRAGVPVVIEAGQRSSDHWSFVQAGLPGVRLGSTPYAGYHSAADVPSVVSAAQLERTARTVVAWLR
jgi:aminopeptidase YwaD